MENHWKIFRFFKPIEIKVKLFNKIQSVNLIYFKKVWSGARYIFLNWSEDPDPYQNKTDLKNPALNLTIVSFRLINIQNHFSWRIRCLIASKIYFYNSERDHYRMLIQTVCFQFKKHELGKEAVTSRHNKEDILLYVGCVNASWLYF